jgi:hypothetical protein
MTWLGLVVRAPYVATAPQIIAGYHEAADIPNRV